MCAKNAACIWRFLPGHTHVQRSPCDCALGHAMGGRMSHASALQVSGTPPLNLYALSHVVPVSPTPLSAGTEKQCAQPRPGPRTRPRG